MLKWSKELPEDVGWYWKRRPDHFAPHKWEIAIDYVRDYAGKLCIANWEISNVYEWAGPIPLPEEPDEEGCGMQGCKTAAPKGMAPNGRCRCK